MRYQAASGTALPKHARLRKAIVDAVEAGELQTGRRVGQPFIFGFKGEDKWGNPSHQVRGRFTPEASLPVQGLPEANDVQAGSLANPDGHRTWSNPTYLMR